MTTLREYALDAWATEKAKQQQVWAKKARRQVKKLEEALEELFADAVEAYQVERTLDHPHYRAVLTVRDASGALQFTDDAKEQLTCSGCVPRASRRKRAYPLIVRPIWANCWSVLRPGKPIGDPRPPRVDNRVPTLQLSHVVGAVSRFERPEGFQPPGEPSDEEQHYMSATQALMSLGDDGMLNAPVSAALAEVWIDRDLSWLDFNDRVLAEAVDERTPLLERAKFLAIFTANLDEFFMKRIAVLRDRLTPERLQIIEQIRDKLLPMLHRQAACFRDQIVPALAQSGVHLRRWDELTAAQQQEASDYFETHISPALTPLVIDPVHPFPFLSNLSVCPGRRPCPA